MGRNFVTLHPKSVESGASVSKALALAYHIYIYIYIYIYICVCVCYRITFILPTATVVGWNCCNVDNRVSRFQNSIKGNKYLAVRNTFKLNRLILNFGIKLSMNIKRENSPAIFYNYSFIKHLFSYLKAMLLYLELLN